MQLSQKPKRLSFPLDVNDLTHAILPEHHARTSLHHCTYYLFFLHGTEAQGTHKRDKLIFSPVFFYIYFFNCPRAGHLELVVVFYVLFSVSLPFSECLSYQRLFSGDALES